MILVGPDTLVVQLWLPFYHDQLENLIQNLQVSKDRSFEPMNLPWRGDWTVTTYPERSKGSWLAFQTWIPPEKDSPQKIPLEWRVYTSPIREASGGWPLELTFRSLPCWSMPFAPLWAWAIEHLVKLVEKPDKLVDENGQSLVKSRVSRVDLAVDTDEIDFSLQDGERFVTRARSKSSYFQEESFDFPKFSMDEVGLYSVGRTFTGFRFGKKDLLVRIYNKWEEISKSKTYKQDKRWFGTLWQMYGWDKTHTVWRIEAQIRRAMLHELVLDSGEKYAHLPAPELVEHLPALISYLYGTWLTLRIPSQDKNKYRWEMDGLWQSVMEKARKNVGIVTRRNLPIQFNSVSLAQSLTGYLSSFAVSLGVDDLPQLIVSLPVLLAKTLNLTPKEWEFRVTADIKQKASKHGVILKSMMPGGTSLPDPAMSKEKDELGLEDEFARRKIPSPISVSQKFDFETKKPRSVG